MDRKDLAGLLSFRRQEDTGYGRCGLTMAVQTNSDRADHTLFMEPLRRTYAK
jgi:hypothetical protein